jgi:cyclase
MKRVRVIPVLLLDGAGLVKGERFKNHTYVGDPINTLKLFNDKEVDEIVVLDISATNKKRTPNYELISEIASEVFMPLAYGGGITNIDQIKKILSLGVEKIVLNSSAHSSPGLIREAAQNFGSQSVIVSVDVKKNFFGKYEVWTHSGKINTGQDPIIFAKKAEELGAGEIYFQNIEKEGANSGYDLLFLHKLAESVKIPVIAGAGAASSEDFLKAIREGGASAVSAGRMFIFVGPHKAVLVNYPSQDDLKRNLFDKLG